MIFRQREHLIFSLHDRVYIRLHLNEVKMSNHENPPNDIACGAQLSMMVLDQFVDTERWLKAKIGR
jgi:hypothetical protein